MGGCVKGMGAGMKQRVNEAVDDYMAHRRSLDHKAGTIENVKGTMTRMLQTVPGNIFVENIQPHHMDQLFTELAKTRGPAARAQNHHHMVAFFKWCAATKRMPRHHDPMINRQVPSWSSEERRRVDVRQFPVLLDAATNPRNRAWIAAGLYLLIRGNEIANLRVRDVDFQSRKIRVEVSKKRGKGKQRIDYMPITLEMRDELVRWFAFYQNECGPLDPDWWLFPNMSRPRPMIGNGGRTTIDNTTQVLLPTKKANRNYSAITNPALEAIGFKTRDDNGKSLQEGGHTLRRSGARARFDALRDMGYDGALRHVQALLHHEHSQMTEHYIGLDLDRLTRNEMLEDQYMYPQNAPQDDVIPLKREATGTDGLDLTGQGMASLIGLRREA